MSKVPLLEVNNLKKYFPVRKGLLQRVVGHVKAVDDISLYINEGETLGLVGESGCGKTTAGRTLLQLYEVDDGNIVFSGDDIAIVPVEAWRKWTAILCALAAIILAVLFPVLIGRGASMFAALLGLLSLIVAVIASMLVIPDYFRSARRLRELRRNMQIVFQDPYSSLNPRMTIKSIVEEGLVVHKVGTRKERLDRVKEVLEKVGLDKSYINRYPHEFSGGQRQRISVARALTLNPKFIVLDEPISALDVSIQSQIINLLNDLKDEFQLTYLFISHDLSVVEYISDRVAVMYLGEIVETAASEDLYRHPMHPYTLALLSSSPALSPTEKKDRIVLDGDVPSPINPPSGCRFHPRCPLATETCKTKVPVLMTHEEHSVACHAVAEEIEKAGGNIDREALSTTIRAEMKKQHAKPSSVSKS